MRKELVLQSIFFVAGFTTVFSIIGLVLEVFLSSNAYLIKNILSKIGGVLIIAFGILLLDIIHIPALEQTKRFSVKKTRYKSLTSFFFGAAFAAGWSPCIGAILGAIITLAAQQPSGAFMLLIAYSLGVGIPFIISAALIENLKLHKIGKYSAYIHKGFGVLLIILGILLITQQLYSISILHTPLFANIEYALIGYEVNIIIAFMAGIISFFSPCVLPLLPAYLAFIGGMTKD